jgi:mannose-6-phosphate isomerase-like protein (cupin superfamily)
MKVVGIDWDCSVSVFAFHYRAAGYPMNSALMQSVFHTDVSSSTLVWDEGPFLVEMYLMKPNSKVVQHSHPFDNVVIFLNGELKGTRQGGIDKPSWLTGKNAEQIGFELPANYWHEFEVGPNGCVFFNVSKWHDVEQKTSATIKYTGKPLGPIHARQLEAQNRTTQSS